MKPDVDVPGPGCRSIAVLQQRGLSFGLEVQSCAKKVRVCWFESSQPHH